MDVHSKFPPSSSFFIAFADTRTPLAHTAGTQWVRFAEEHEHIVQMDPNT